jgi:hypothetical protein
MDKLQSRREFCIKAGTASAAAFLSTNSGAKASEMAGRPPVPSHLPAKLAVCSCQWAWFTMSDVNEAYYDLEEVMIGLKKRKYNAIRIDTALNWCFHKDGSPRGPVAIRATVPGYSHRFRVLNHRGGNSVDVFERLFQFMELAKKHEIYVILSDWEYMHTTWFVESEALRNEVLGIPLQERLIQLARHMDRLVNALKDKDLAGNIAWIEPHNEANISDFPLGAEGHQLHTEAVAFLRDRHPEILVSASFTGLESRGTTDNSQLYDMHMYVGNELYNSFWRNTIRRENFNFDEPWKDEFLKDLLEPEIVPYSVFKDNWNFHPESRVYSREGWLQQLWTYYNVDVNRFDQWLTGNYHELRDSLLDNATKYYSKHGQEAKRRGTPFVMTEGGFHYGPLLSRFEESEFGLEYYDYLTDLAINNDLWAFAFSTYNCPAMPVWWAHPKWLTQTNERFLKGTVKGA